MKPIYALKGNVKDITGENHPYNSWDKEIRITYLMNNNTTESTDIGCSEEEYLKVKSIVTDHSYKTALLNIGHK